MPRFVGIYEFTGSTIRHMVNDNLRTVIETGVPDPAALILDAVRVGQAGPFAVTQRGNDHIMLVNGDPLDLFELIRAALLATAE